MDSEEFAAWLAFYSQHPFGDQRADWRAGVVASTMANMWGGKGKFAPGDFMLHGKRKAGLPATKGNMLPMFKALAAMTASAPET